jgi:hypothetical protein
MRIVFGVGAVIVGAVKLAQLYTSNEPFERKAMWSWIGLIVARIVLVGAEVALAVMD